MIGAGAPLLRQTFWSSPKGESDVLHRGFVLRAAHERLASPHRRDARAVRTRVRRTKPPLTRARRTRPVSVARRGALRVAPVFLPVEPGNRPRLWRKRTNESNRPCRKSCFRIRTSRRTAGLSCQTSSWMSVCRNPGRPASGYLGRWRSPEPPHGRTEAKTPQLGSPPLARCGRTRRVRLRHRGSDQDLGR